MKKVLFILFLFLFPYSLKAQTWTLQASVSGTLYCAWAVNANTVWMCGAAGMCVRTINGGATWTRVGETQLAGNELYTITAVNDQIAIAGADDGTIWRTTNGGAIWNLIIPTPPPLFIDVIHMFDANNGFCLSDPNTAGFWLYYITTNGGANWTIGANRPPNAAGESGYNNSYTVLDTGHIWWGTNVGKIWKGSFRGPFTSGTTVYPSQFAMAFNDALTGVCATTTGGTVTGPFATTINGGNIWTNTGFTPPVVCYSMKSIPYSGIMWAGTGTTIYRSINSGLTWTSQLTSINSCYALTFVNYNLGWAGTQGGIIYKYTDAITSHESNNNGIPTCYSLEQNYPNPFNPATNINFSIPKASNVSVKIYDVLGNEVMTVVNEFKNAGKYTEEVNASNLSSGVYFYTIKAGDFTASKKMSLIK